MPIQSCSKGGKPGYKYGENGTCYTYTSGNKASRNAAYTKAAKQAAAIKASQARSSK